MPDARRVHTTPTPRFGGVAIFTAFIIAVVVFGDQFYVNQAVGILVGATLVSLTGAIDDQRGVSAYAKMGVQIAAALILAFTGVRISMLGSDILNIVATVAWVGIVTNALNLLDNMDGLAGGLAAITSAFFLLMAVESQQFLVGALAAGLFGACLGFLRYNYNPASIFMGDSGALFIGFVLAALGIKLRFPDNPTIVSWMVPVLALGLPLFDTTLVIIARLRRGVNPLITPGKDHISHRLVALGYTRREAVLTCYLIACALGAIAIFVTHVSVMNGYFISAVVVLTGLWALWQLELSRPPGFGLGQSPSESPAIPKQVKQL